MSHPLKVSELTQSSPTYDGAHIEAQIKITNISNTYINNLKLVIQTDNPSILKKVIIRERGSLSFDPEIKALDIGNLAPDETAYFEYDFKASETVSTLSDHMLLSYTPDSSCTTNTSKLSLLFNTYEEDLAK